MKYDKYNIKATLKIVKLDNNKVIMIYFWRQSGSYSEYVMRKLLSSL